ncbi:MAG: phosphatidate cytidylyltransferase, partial [Alphaproteobacteria bacterium]|nr:phosphatidate cytidylyltransferase [Alphaproteobacteria bacterium]
VTLGAYTTPWPERRWTVLGVVYVGIGSVAMLQLREFPGTGRDLVFFLLAAVWLSDIGGYTVGRLVGGAKLAPSISPAKTWSGAVGSVGFAMIGAGLFALYAGIGLAFVVVVAGALSVAAQAGDLFESWIKRRFDVKDSGASIPGHGGVLDRVDGVLFAAPALAVFVIVSGTEFLQWQ